MDESMKETLVDLPWNMTYWNIRKQISIHRADMDLFLPNYNLMHPIEQMIEEELKGSIKNSS